MQNPANTILEVSMMYAVPGCLHVIAEMGVADALGDDPRTAADLAASTGANADALARALRWCLLTGSSFGRIIRSPCDPLSA